MLGYAVPADRAEERLLVRSADPVPPPAIAADGAPPRAADFDAHVSGLANVVWNQNLPFVVATDGG